MAARSHSPSRAGFVLSEALIALTITAMAVSLFLAAASAIARHLERANARSAAALVAAEVIRDARLAGRGCPASTDGVTDGYPWRLEVDCVAEPAPPLHLGAARLTVIVIWRSAPDPAHLELETWHWVMADG